MFYMYVLYVINYNKFSIIIIHAKDGMTALFVVINPQDKHIERSVYIYMNVKTDLSIFLSCGFITTDKPVSCLS